MRQVKKLGACVVIVLLFLLIVGFAYLARSDSTQNISKGRANWNLQEIANTGSQEMSEDVAIKEVGESHVTRGDLAMDVSWPRSTVLGEPVIVRIALKNHWTKRVLLSLEYNHREVSIHVYDSQQQPVDLTEHGVWALKSDDGAIGSAKLKILAPDTSYTWEKDLNKCFKLRPGRYTASVAVDVMIEDIPNPSITTVRSNENEFEIIPR